MDLNVIELTKKSHLNNIIIEIKCRLLQWNYLRFKIINRINTIGKIIIKGFFRV